MSPARCGLPGHVRVGGFVFDDLALGYFEQRVRHPEPQTPAAVRERGVHLDRFGHDRLKFKVGLR